MRRLTALAAGVKSEIQLVNVARSVVQRRGMTYLLAHNVARKKEKLDNHIK